MTLYKIFSPFVECEPTKPTKMRRSNFAQIVKIHPEPAAAFDALQQQLSLLKIKK